MRLIDSTTLILESDGNSVPLIDIVKAPTVDAVEVVRCKDCAWFNKAGCAIYIVDDSDKPKENDFCSYGERKDNG